MTDLFLYGTLRHLPLLWTVLGRDGDASDLVEAHLPHHRVTWVLDEPFPMIARSPDHVAQGIVLLGLSDDDMARLNFYEGGFDYTLREMTVTQADGTQRLARLYFPDAELWQPGLDWSLSEWAARWGAITVAAAEEVMGYFGNRDAADVARMFPMIRTRASSRVRANQGSSAWVPSGKGADQVTIYDRRRVHANYFALDELDLSFEKFDGERSARTKREVFVLQDAAIILPYDPVTDRVLLVEQMRSGPLVRGDDAVWQLEAVAGRIDPGETPEEAARREAREEAGLDIRSLETVAEAYASPSCTTEYYFIYIGIADLPETGGDGYGLSHETEDIRTLVMSFDQLMEMVDHLHAANAPLVLAALWLARARDRLRMDATR
ncbi:MAG: NUDIX domain-containing protein [Pseudomonadota bacterium]